MPGHNQSSFSDATPTRWFVEDAYVLSLANMEVTDVDPLNEYRTVCQKCQELGEIILAEFV